MQRHLPENARNAHAAFFGEHSIHVERQILAGEIADRANCDGRNAERGRFTHDLKALHLDGVRDLAQVTFLFGTRNHMLRAIKSVHDRRAAFTGKRNKRCAAFQNRGSSSRRAGLSENTDFAASTCPIS